MSIRALSWVFEYSETTGSDRLVFIAIADHVSTHGDARGWAWPSVEVIAAHSRLGRSTVFRSLDALERSGELIIERRHKQTSLYALAALAYDDAGSQIETDLESKGPDSGRMRSQSRAKEVPGRDPEPRRTKSEPPRARTRGSENGTQGAAASSPPGAAAAPSGPDFATWCDTCGKIEFDCICGQQTTTNEVAIRAIRTIRDRYGEPLEEEF